MAWKDTVNGALHRATGYELRKVGGPSGSPRRRVKAGRGDRLIERPVFIMCTLRSGSTLFRVLLNSHSQLHSPHELHLRYISASLDKKWSVRSMKETGIDEPGLRYLLWDRILHRELAASGKKTIVEKTPNNVFIADQIKQAWPDARFVYLLRHPAAIARSRKALRPEDADDEANVDLIRRYCEALERDRHAFPGHTVRYEELTAEPERVLRGVCDFLEIGFEPTMIEYGEHDHGRFKSGLGDYADKIKTGRIQPPEPPPAEIPEPLREIAATWGYAPAPERSAQS